MLVGIGTSCIDIPMQNAGLQPDEYTFGGLINACAKAQHPPYELAESYADKALELFGQMKGFNLTPNVVHYNTVMSCQVCSSKLCPTYHHAPTISQRPSGCPKRNS